ncbi:conserved hypothetical protein [Flavobacterium psychrophilum]|nr:hypothetical protein [Flavobacterium psychrophilum]SNB10761.1 conserved hypothetical protein [Flavobacterium psychrophilum]
MKETVEDKLDIIAKIWNNFILEYKICSSKIKFNDDVKTNYFGNILGCFKDTFDIIFTTNKYSNYTEKFSFTISFLQAIYIQQDFIQEMLEIFRTGIEKGDLKKDQTYYINRDLRNELIGHPIRKDVSRAETIQKKCDSCGKILKPKNKLALLSSTFFSYQESEDEIEYLLYHRDNDFRFESKTFKIIDIQERHRLFLETYLDIILEKFKIILNDYLSEISKLEKVIEKGNFETVLKLVELYLEAIFKYSPIYNKESLIKIHARANEHRRYKNFIDTFNIDLRKNLSEKKNSVNKILDRKVIDKSPFQNSSLPKFKIAINTTNTKGFNVKPHKDDYHYEIGKITEKRNFIKFGNLLKDKCKDNKLVQNELIHMQKNIQDDIEYYTALRLISTELNTD